MTLKNPLTFPNHDITLKKVQAQKFADFLNQS